ncbi:response regulator, partial [candidate division KSB1 bacterium]|nr:response regulator [candidate division KSB1 bacterium]
DGREIHVYIEDRLVFDEERNIVGIRSTVQDITDRKKLEDELFKIRNLESLGTFAGGIAHDFNNILTGIMCNLSLARVIPSSDREEMKSVLKDTEYAAMRAKDLTQQLLTFSKGGAPVKKTVSIGELIKESASFVTSGSNVKCVCDIPDDLWQVDIDRGQMSQVVSNLVINADQSMPAGGTIRICAKNTDLAQDSHLPLDPGQYIKISVIDKGVGIPEEYLSKIFDPYFSTKQKGSGLGLSIVFSIIKNHDGFITVDSTPGAGTTFEIYLPAAEKEPISDAETKSNLEKGHGKILIMDDEENVRKAARKIIRHLGYSVQTTGDGKETIELYKNEMEKGAPFDAVILDLTIPGGMGGKETVSRLLQLDPDANVIVSSGYSDDSIMANYASHGFSGVIAKPYRIHEMGDVLHNVLQQ